MPCSGNLASYQELVKSQTYTHQLLNEYILITFKSIILTKSVASHLLSDWSILACGKQTMVDLVFTEFPSLCCSVFLSFISLVSLFLLLDNSNP